MLKRLISVYIQWKKNRFNGLMIAGYLNFSFNEWNSDGLSTVKGTCKR